MPLPARYREALSRASDSTVVLTLSPMDRALLLYPLVEWEEIEHKLTALSDFDRSSRRTKQMMRGHASDQQLDGQGRILIARELRDYAGLTQACMCLGQGSKCEIWDVAQWQQQRDEWLLEVDNGDAGASKSLSYLSL